MRLPFLPWLLALSSPPNHNVGSSKPTPKGIYMLAPADGGERFLAAREEVGAVAELVPFVNPADLDSEADGRAGDEPPTAWTWTREQDRGEGKGEWVRIRVNGSDPELCLAAPVGADGMPKTGDLELVLCPTDDAVDYARPHPAVDDASQHLLAGARRSPGPDPTLWIRMAKSADASSFLMPTGHLFLGYSREMVASTNNYEWRSEWIALGGNEGR